MTAATPSRRVYMAAADTTEPTDPRTVATAKQQKAEVVYLFVDDNWQLGASSAVITEQKEQLEDIADSVDLLEVDIGNVYSVLMKATTKAAEHSSDDVQINISGGPNTAAVGLAMSAMTTEAEAIHVEGSTALGEQQLSLGEGDIETVPEYPIDTPTYDQLQVMQYIDEEHTGAKRPKMKRLIDHAIEDDLESLTNGEPGENVDRSTEYRRLNSRIINPLLAREYITLNERGSQKRVTLTEVGQLVYEAFAHELE